MNYTPIPQDSFPYSASIPTPRSYALGLAGISGEKGGFSYGPLDEMEALELIFRAYQSGIRIFDTAPIYGYGESERRLGKALKTFFQDIPRGEVEIMTKGGVDWGSDGRIFHINRKEIIQRMLQESLERMELEYLDTYWIHAFGQDTSGVFFEDLCESISYLEELKKKGIIKKIGISNISQAQWNIAKQFFSISAIQNPFHFFIPKEEVDWVSDEGLELYTYSPLASGVIAQKNLNKKNWNMLPESDYRKKMKSWNSPKEVERRQKYYAFLEKHFRDEKYTSTQLGLLWGYYCYPKSITVLGPKTKEHLDYFQQTLKEFPMALASLQKLHEALLII